MKVITVFCCFFLLAFSLRVQSLHQSEKLVGGYEEQDANNLGDDLKEIDTYLKTQFPELQNSKLIKAETQIVQGVNYKYTYDLNDKPNTRIEFTVWDISWLKERKISEAKKIFEVRGADSQQV